MAGLGLAREVNVEVRADPSGTGQKDDPFGSKDDHGGRWSVLSSFSDDVSPLSELCESTCSFQTQRWLLR